MTKRNWGFWNKSRHSCLLGFLMTCFLMLAFISGCSDSGGTSKTVYNLTGYDGINLRTGNSNLNFYSEYPWYVNATYQVFDKNGNGVSDLKVEDFQVLENGSAVSIDNSEIRLLQRNTLSQGYTYTLKTVIMIDNTPSSENYLAKQLEAAQVVVDNIDEQMQQVIAIVAYDDSGDPYLVQDFTNNETGLTVLLEPEADNTIKMFSGTTNF